MMHGGYASRLPAWAPPTAASDSSSTQLLPTPDAAEGGGRGGSQSPDKRAETGRTINLADVLEHVLPTPMSGGNAKSARSMRKSHGDQRTGGGQSSIPGLDEIATMLDGERPEHLPPDEELSSGVRALVEELLPTPKTKDRASRGPGATGGPDLGEAVNLLVTPSASEGTGVGTGRRADSTLRGQVDQFVPTPTVQHAARSRTVENRNPDSQAHIGTTLQDFCDLLPTPSAHDGTAGGDLPDREGGPSLQEAAKLMPTPSTMGGGERNRSGARSDELLLPGVVEQLMPTPRATDGSNGGPAQRGSAGDLALPSAALQLMPTPDAQMGGAGGRSGDPERTRDRGHHVTINEVAQHLPAWGPYEPAIRRWEHVLGRYAPWATEPSKRSKKGRLSPKFVEWLMGWPLGWVTALTFLSRNQQLKILGNGVVPQQAAEAVRFLLHEPARHEPARRRGRVNRRATPRALMRAAREAS